MGFQIQAVLNFYGPVCASRLVKMCEAIAMSSNEGEFNSREWKYPLKLKYDKEKKKNINLMWNMLYTEKNEFRLPWISA